MKYLWILSLFVIFQTTNVEAHLNEIPSIGEVRSLYQKSMTSEDACKKLIQILESYKKDPLYLGYSGCATMLMAKHAFNPFSKFSYFKKGKRMLEEAIKADEKNFELRFLRFTAQTNMPSFLGYNGNITKDKTFILDSFSQIKDVKLEEYVLPSLRESKDLTQSEKEKLK
ncbi:MAG TPA: hypothetical protein VMU83_17040 [Hanamia sp.]|nr:hypothetical protein [Hanamia sp.]